MITKTVRSRFNHEIGQKVEGCTILEKRVIIPPKPDERRLGVYDYLVEVPPAAVKPSASSHHAAPETGSYTRTTPDALRGGLIRRIPSR